MRYILILLFLPFFACAQLTVVKNGVFCYSETNGDTTGVVVLQPDNIMLATVGQILFESQGPTILVADQLAIQTQSGISIETFGVLNLKGLEINLMTDRAIIENEWNGYRYGMSTLEAGGGYTAYKYNIAHSLDEFVFAINEHSLYLEVTDSIHNGDPFILKGIRFPKGTNQNVSIFNGDNMIELTPTGLRVNGFEALNDTIPAGARPIVENGVVIDWVY